MLSRFFIPFQRHQSVAEVVVRFDEGGTKLDGLAVMRHGLL
jgi:hypothetical protein